MNDVWLILQSILFWKTGDTANILDPKTVGDAVDDDPKRTDINGNKT
jgi:hypothetical protein